MRNTHLILACILLIMSCCFAGCISNLPLDDSDRTELNVYCFNDVLNENKYSASFQITNPTSVAVENVKLSVTIHEGGESGPILGKKTYSLDYLNSKDSEIVKAYITLSRVVDDVTAVYYCEWDWTTSPEVKQPSAVQPAKGIVLVDSIPSGASVYISGDFKGTTPLTLSLLPETSYMIVVEKSGYNKWAQAVSVSSEKTSRVVAQLVPISSPTYTPPATTPTVNPTTAPTSKPSPDEYIEKNYKWDYGGYTWTYQTYIPRQQYLYYKNLNRKPSNYQEYLSNTYNRQLTSNFANLIVEKGMEKGLSKDQCVLMAVSFVQSIPYKTDRESVGMDEYYKYPIETLVDGCGDCEDSAILTATIVRDMGYGVVLLRFYDHVAVGIKGGDTIYGTYWTYNGERYFYLETTYPGWEIGQVPDKYKDETATIIPVY